MNDDRSQLMQIPDQLRLTRQFFEHNPLSILLVDARLPDMPIVYANRAFAQMTGYRPEELIGQNCRILQGGDLDQQELEIIRTAIRNRTSCIVQLRNYRKDGSMFWNELHLSPMLDEDGTLTHFFGIQHDVTSRRQMQQDLASRHGELDNFFNYALDPWCIADHEGNFVRVNRAWEEILGYPISQLEGKRFLDFVHPEDIPMTLKAMEVLEAGKPVLNFINRYRNAEGAYRYIEWRSYPYGRLTYAAARDITERFQLEESLRQSEERFSRAFMDSPVPMVMTTTDPERPIYIAANEAYQRLVGYTWAELEGYSLTDLEIAISDERRLERLTTLEQAHLYHLREARIRNRHGDIRDVAISAQRIEIAHQAYDIEIMLDITDRRHATERELAMKLEQERVRLLTTFVRHVSHEFRTPLAAINSSVYLMVQSEDKAYRQHKASQIEQQVRRSNRLIEMLLKVVQLESDLPEQEPVRLQTVVEVVCARHSGFEESAPISCACPDEVPTFIGYPDLLREALEQLLDNARQHTPPSGNITLRVRLAEGGVMLEVEDTGSGIAPEYLPRVFETFWRQDIAHTTPGFGLGLTIARKIVDLHGGQITVESQVGAGSCFRVFLPIPAPAPGQGG